MNKLLTNTLLLGALSLGSVSAFAANEKGNGGDAVICGENVYILDYVEAFGDTNEFELDGPIDSLVAKLTLPLKLKDGYLYKHVKDSAEVFLRGILEYESSGVEKTSTVEFTRGKISNVADESFFSVPENCNVEQLVVRRDTNSFVGQEFLVRKSLWDKMSNFQKAVTVLHEAFYKYMLANGKDNSFLAREYNKMLLKNEFPKLSDYEYLKLMEEFNIEASFIKSNLRIDGKVKSQCLYNNNLEVQKLSEKYYPKDIRCDFDEVGNINSIELLARYIRPLKFVEGEFSYVDFTSLKDIKKVIFTVSNTVKSISGDLFPAIAKRHALSDGVELVQNDLVSGAEIKSNRGVCSTLISGETRCWANYSIESYKKSSTYIYLNGLYGDRGYATLEADRYIIHDAPALTKRKISLSKRKFTDKRSSLYTLTFDIQHSLIKKEKQ